MVKAAIVIGWLGFSIGRYLDGKLGAEPILAYVFMLAFLSTYGWFVWRDRLGGDQSKNGKGNDAEAPSENS